VSALLLRRSQIRLEFSKGSPKPLKQHVYINYDLNENARESLKIIWGLLIMLSTTTHL
jgi:hypothetical protein